MARLERIPIHDIMVWGGVHGFLPGGEGGPGVPLVKSLQEDPIRTNNGFVEADIANPEAVKRGRRYVEKDLSLCLGQPEGDKKTHEGQLVPDILERSKNRGLVVDMHQQSIPSDLDYVYIGSHVAPQALGFAAKAGITTLFVGDDGLCSKIPQAVAVDLSKTSRRNHVGYWRSILSTILHEGLPSPSVEEFTIYASANLTESEHEQLGLSGEKFTPFDEVPGAADFFGVKGPVYALYSKGYEVAMQLDEQGLWDIEAEDGTLHFPTLRSFSIKDVQE